MNFARTFHNRVKRKIDPSKLPIPVEYTNLIKSKKFANYTTVFSISSLYLYFLYKARKSDHEMIRVGAAGSLTMLLSESAFYWIDNINARTKMLNDNLGFREML
jgi:hypothetical protein